MSWLGLKTVGWHWMAISKDVLTMAAVKTSSTPRKNHPWRRIFGWLFENTLLGRFFGLHLTWFTWLQDIFFFSFVAESRNSCKDPLVNRHVMFYEAGLMWLTSVVHRPQVRHFQVALGKPRRGKARRPQQFARWTGIGIEDMVSWLHFLKISFLMQSEKGTLGGSEVCGWWETGCKPHLGG